MGKRPHDLLRQQKGRMFLEKEEIDEILPRIEPDRIEEKPPAHRTWPRPYEPGDTAEDHDNDIENVAIVQQVCLVEERFKGSPTRCLRELLVLVLPVSLSPEEKIPRCDE